jgi:hypothetical protein
MAIETEVSPPKVPKFTYLSTSAEDVNLVGRPRIQVEAYETWRYDPSTLWWIRRLDGVQKKVYLKKDFEGKLELYKGKGANQNFAALEEVQEAVANSEYEPKAPSGEVVLGAHPYMPGEALIDYVAGSEDPRQVASSIAKEKRNYLSRLKRKGLDIVLRRSMHGKSLLIGVGVAALIPAAGTATLYVMYRHRHKHKK